MAKKVQKTKAVAKKAIKPVAKKAAKTIAKPVAKKAAKPVAKKVTKPVAKKAAKPVAKKVAKPAQKAAKPAAKKVVKAAAKKTSKPVAKKVGKVAPAKNKTVAKKSAQTAPKKAVKVVAKKSAKPAAKTVAKPAPKKAVKVVAKKIEKPIAKKGKKVLPVVVKPTPVKPKTVAELIEANKIPVEKNFPISKRELKTTRPTIDNASLYGNDKPVKAPIIGKTKFNDSELAEFKELINNKLSEAIKDYELLKDTLSHRDNNGTDDTSPTFKLLEDGSEVMSKEETTQLAIRQEKFIQNLKNALIRIENKTYGVCRATGNMISKDRLRSVPHATLSIEAKRDQN